MDQYDVAILVELQKDGRLSNRELSERIGLSPTPCWRRVRDLESDGVIQRYAALLDPVAIGIQVTALANVILEDHHPDTVAEFDTTIATIPEVLECHMLSGDYDYALKIKARTAGPGAATPAAAAGAASRPRPQPAAARPSARQSPRPSPRAGAPERYRPRVVVLPMDGLPGDGSESLPRALVKALRAADYEVSPQIDQGDLLVLGEVEILPTETSWERISVTWWVVNANDGRDLGQIDQANDLPPGALNKPWGALADGIAQGAVSGIVDLLERYSRS